jgi:multidrug efflux pump subunit AcrA (membrane-fusion protein)
VDKGNAAWVQAPALGTEEFKATVSRTIWVLDAASRTLRVEIDLPKPARRLRPGMYAKARIELSSGAAVAGKK